MPLIPSLREEEEAWRQVEKANAARQMAAAQVTPEQAAGVAAIHQTYDYLPAGAKVSLGRAGVAPDDPVMATVAEAAVKRKKKKGFGWHSFGDTVKAGWSNTAGRALAAAGEVLDPVTGAISSAAKPILRTGFMALQAPIEEAVGGLRNVAVSLPGQLGEIGAGALAGAGIGGAAGAGIGAIGGPLAGVTALGGALVGGVIGGVTGAMSEDVQGKANWTTQSQLGIAAGRVLAGKKVDTGEGFFVGHESGLFKMQADRARSVASLEGPDGTRSAWTPGRSVANVVVEPGSMQHKALSGLIDGYAALRMDPSALALAKRGKIVAARKTVIGPVLAELLGGKAGDDLAHAIATTTGDGRRLAISKMFNGQLDHDPKILVALGDETDPIKIKELLKPVLGIDVREVPKIVRKRSTIPRLMENTAVGALGEKVVESRLMADVPRGIWDLDDPASAMKKLEDFLKIGKVPADQQARLMDNFIGTLAGPRSGNLPVLKQAMEATKAVLVSRGATNDAATKMTRMFGDTYHDAARYSGMAIAEGTALDDLGYLVVNGQREAIQSPHLIAEMLGKGVPIPDMRDISRSVARLARITDHPLTNVGVDSADKVMTKWKQMAILRAAYVPRVVGEEMVRMATSGYDSLFKHPMSFIAGRIAAKNENTAVKSLHDVPLTMEEEVRGALNASKGSEVLSRSPVRMKNRERIAYTPDNHDDFVQGWKNHELGVLSGDPIATKVAELMRTGSVGAVDETGAKAINNIDELKAAFSTGRLRRFRTQLNDSLAGTDDAAYFDDVNNANNYIDSVVERVTHFTRNDQTLLDGIHKGLDNVDGKEIRTAMDNLIAADNFPEAAVGEKFGGKLSEDAVKLYDKITDFAFEWIATKPTNFMSRSPVLEQSYWKNVERMLPAMSPADQAEALRLARASKLPARRIKEIEASAKIPFSGDALPLDDVHMVAARQATDDVKKLLYDISARKQWSEASRLVFPFAEAWQEMMTTWGKLLVQNPVALRRGQQTVEGARGAGFFSTDEYGSESFVYPGSTWLTDKLVGAPIGIRGSVGGLNLFANSPVLPGFGPVAQIAADALLPDKPEFDWVQDVVNPFGQHDTGSGWVESFLPAWTQKARKVMTSDDSDRVFNNTVFDMARYLTSSGQGDTSTLEGQEQLSQDAISMAKRMYLLRTLGSFSLPSAPQPEMVGEDKEGRVVTQFAIIAEYRALQMDPGTKTKVGNKTVEGVGWEEAPEAFIETFGEDALLYMQPKTKGSGSPLEDTLDWVRENPSLVRKYEETYQFFAPHSGKFSMTAYERQLATGEREALKPDEAVELANSRVASMQYRQAKEMIGPKPSDEQRVWLRQVKEALVDEYPGYVPEEFDPAKTPRRIRELEQALSEPKLAATEVGQALKTYFEAREVGMQQAQAAGLGSFDRAKSAAPVRQWLRDVATALTEEYPGFAEVWDTVLSREMVADDAPAEIPQPSQ